MVSEYLEINRENRPAFYLSLKELKMNVMKLFNGKLAVALLFVVSLFASCASGDNVSEFVTAELNQKKVPLFIDRDNAAVLEILLDVKESGSLSELSAVELVFDNGDVRNIISNIKVNHEVVKENEDHESSALFPEVTSVSRRTRIRGNQALDPGKHRLTVDFSVNDDVLLEKSFQVEEVRLTFGRNGRLAVNSEGNFRYRPALVIRAAGQDDCDTYRIPGIVTTSKGTLIAVYDNRYNNSKDLQEDIDVGMSRSTDGGQTWEPMRVIMDMGEWGGRPRRLNGIGDPAVLYDHTTGTIWVAALWISGSHYEKMLWWDSRPGMSPEETGQFVLVKSTDDGLTWSDPINITEQIKDPEWQLLLAGPGMGITLDNGTLIFAAQFKEDIGVQALDGGQYTCHSTIVYSKDGGETWQIGTGAKPNTTEAQVVQLADGGLMLNMRDDLNRRVKDETNGRAVSVTYDMGQTWVKHPTSNSALPEPNCMASLIAHNMRVDGQMQQVLFFSNPNDKHRRVNMTIKASFDAGHTWPESTQILLNETPGFGYSCMTMVDDNNVGILYEGVKDLFFQKVPVSEFLK
jgi:sialidase-1